MINSVSQNINELKNKILLADCMDIMAQMPDKHIDLAIVDPPYGIGEDGGDKKRGRKKDNYNKIVIHKKKQWDNSKPTKKYFKELFRISKNQIIWGGNYFVEHLYSSMGWLYWEKMIGGDFSDGELAWTSFKKALRQFKYSYHGDTKGGHTRIHPTQKPLALGRWCLQKYAKKGDLIFDSHSGSGTFAIACYLEGFDFIACEKDEDYWKDSVVRFDEIKEKQTIDQGFFKKKVTTEQRKNKLFS